MEKTYIWFAVKTNIILFIIGVLYGSISGFLPFEFIISFIASGFLKVFLVAILTVIAISIPSYFAFKFTYQGIAKVQNIKLIDAILYVIILEAIIDILYTNFTNNHIEISTVATALVMKYIVTFIAYYLAGVKYQPSVVTNNPSAAEGNNVSNMPPPPPPSYFDPKI